MSRLTLKVASFAVAALTGMSPGWAQTLDQIMDSVSPRPPGTSYSVAIVRDGEPHFASRGGASPDSKYMLASVSKQFTAAAILALEDEGKLKLSDTVPKFLPNLPAWNQLTIKSLLNHQTTLPDYVSGQPYVGGAAFGSGISLANLLTMIASVAGIPVRRPCLQYSNSNYATLAAIVEAASGKPFGTYLREAIFSPSNMTNTSYSGGVLTGVQQGHFQNGAVTPNYNSSWANGAGGVVTTARDMAKWNMKLMGGFLSIVDRARDDVVSGSCIPGGIPSRYAYGWIVRSDGALEHSGSVEGYSAYNIVNPDKDVAVAVLSNYAGYAGGMPAFARALSNVAVVSGSGPGGGEVVERTTAVHHGANSDPARTRAGSPASNVIGQLPTEWPWVRPANNLSTPKALNEEEGRRFGGQTHLEKYAWENRVRGAGRQAQARTYETAAGNVDPTPALFTAPLGIVKTLLS